MEDVCLRICCSYETKEQNRKNDLKGDATKLKEKLNWNPEYTFESMMDEMVAVKLQEYDIPTVHYDVPYDPVR